MMQLALFAPAPRRVKPIECRHVVQGQERPADLPGLDASAKTVGAVVLDWFESQADSRGYLPRTPSMCAAALGFDVTTVRPRITQLQNRTQGPRLEACRWIRRKPTLKSSEGWLRFVDGGSR